MKLRAHVDALFADYDDTASMRDFKEELYGNLTDRMDALRKQGLSDEEALRKALTELGDVSVVAEELSMKKKQDVYSDMYMGTRKYLTPGRTVLFILGGLVVCFGAMSAAITWFATELQVASLASGMIFIAAGGSFLTFMGLTKETATNHPMSWKRAIFYALSVLLFLMGIFTVPLVFFAASGTDPSELAAHGWNFSQKSLGLSSAIATCIPFLLPGIALFVFLVLTEKDRHKPWVTALREQAAKQERDWFASEKAAARFGILSGVIWITAIALFVLLTILFGFKFSWLALVAALVGQMLLLTRTGSAHR